MEIHIWTIVLATVLFICTCCLCFALRSTVCFPIRFLCGLFTGKNKEGSIPSGNLGIKEKWTSFQKLPSTEININDDKIMIWRQSNQISVQSTLDNWNPYNWNALIIGTIWKNIFIPFSYVFIHFGFHNWNDLIIGTNFRRPWVFQLSNCTVYIRLYSLAFTQSNTLTPRKISGRYTQKFGRWWNCARGKFLLNYVFSLKDPKLWDWKLYFLLQTFPLDVSERRLGCAIENLAQTIEWRRKSKGILSNHG